MATNDLLNAASQNLLAVLANHHGVTPETEISSLLQREVLRLGFSTDTPPDGDSTTYDTFFESWASIIELRDQESSGHSQRVTALTLRFAEALGIPPDQHIHIRRGALLHDIGKMAIPDRVLLKNGSLNEEERLLVQQHPWYAYQMLSQLPFLRPALDIPYCHHERWDGQGYPRGLASNDIPLHARLFSIVDVWDALTSERPYAKPRTIAEARAYLTAEKGTIFDPDLIDRYLELDLAPVEEGA